MVEPAIRLGRCGRLVWAVCASAFPGQQRSGDVFLVRATAGSVLVGVVDGLGHGEEAADVAERALEALGQTGEESPAANLTACHRALRGSRGAAVTLASLYPDRGKVVWAGVGNVEAAVAPRGRMGETLSRRAVPLRGGVVGDRLPPLRDFTATMLVGDVLVVATDGIAPAFLDAIDPRLHVPALARRLHREYARKDDDALVLVARAVAAGDLAA